MFRKSILLKAGMYEDTYEYMEDYSLWLKCLRWCKFANIDEKLVDYTVKHNIKYNPELAVLACNNMRNILNKQNIIV
jgi:DNA-directed RNA polymerase subunit L